MYRNVKENECYRTVFIYHVIYNYKNFDKSFAEHFDNLLAKYAANIKTPFA